MKINNLLGLALALVEPTWSLYRIPIVAAPFFTVSKILLSCHSFISLASSMAWHSVSIHHQISNAEEWACCSWEIWGLSFPISHLGYPPNNGLIPAHKTELICFMTSFRKPHYWESLSSSGPDLYDSNNPSGSVAQDHFISPIPKRIWG